MRICEYCGKEFEDPTKVYCSSECLSKACGFEVSIKKCIKCGKNFETLTDAAYCSFECAYDYGDLAKVFLP